MVKGGFYSVFDRVQPVETTKLRSGIANSSKEIEMNKLWLIVRYMKGCCSKEPEEFNRFTLRGGEKIKTGRFVF